MPDGPGKFNLYIWSKTPRFEVAKFEAGPSTPESGRETTPNGTKFFNAKEELPPTNDEDTEMQEDDLAETEQVMDIDGDMVNEDATQTMRRPCGKLHKVPARLSASSGFVAEESDHRAIMARIFPGGVREETDEEIARWAMDGVD